MAGGFLDRERTKPVNAQAALKWVLSNEGVHTTIPGLAAFDHLTSALPVLGNITMTEQEKRDVNLGVADNGLYCNNCQACVPSCPKQLPVPEMMRAYMYAYGYGSTKMAYDLLCESGIGASPCGDCNDCVVKCVNRFNVREKIMDVSRVVNIPSDFLT